MHVQVSDDSELAIALAIGLLDPAATTTSARWDSVAHQYCRWYRTEPFSCGMTCHNAFSLDPDTPNLAAQMKQQAVASNMGSKANGALMRLTPLIVYSQNLPQSDLVKMVKDDAALSHPNETCQDVNAVYAVAIAHLIQNPGDGMGAFEAAESYSATSACEEVKAWFEESKADCSDLNCKQMMGFAKWAFILSFWHLGKSSSFVEALSHALGRGGDTDTNAAIVGCMMGALHGADAIPTEFKEVLEFSHDKYGGYPRPDWLLPRLALQHTDDLYAAAVNGFEV